MAVATWGRRLQTTADDVLGVTRKANDYFMTKYSDPTVPTNVNKIRPSTCGHVPCTTRTDGALRD